MSIEAEYRQLLLQMECWCSYGTTMNFSSSRGGDSSSDRPAGESWPLHLEWASRWNKATSKGIVLIQAREAFERRQKQLRIEVVPETQAELEARIIKDGEGWSVRDIAQSCRCTEKMVRKARERANVSADTGKPIVKRKPEAPERLSEALAMRKRGLTLKQIGAILHCDAATVQRDLAKAA